MQKLDDIWCVAQVYSVDPQAESNTATLPPEIQKLIHSFANLFAEPLGLPPSRYLDHTIPLLQGAQPFRLKRYKYTPALKDEIEKQVAKLLKSQMIQEGSSPFSSPVLFIGQEEKWRMEVVCGFQKAQCLHNQKHDFPFLSLRNCLRSCMGPSGSLLWT